MNIIITYIKMPTSLDEAWNNPLDFKTIIKIAKNSFCAPKDFLAFCGQSFSFLLQLDMSEDEREEKKKIDYYVSNLRWRSQAAN